MTLLIQAARIAYQHGGNPILIDATFEIRAADRLALVGANGSGKSTLFRLMSRGLVPDRGVVTHARGVRVGMLAQEAAIDPETTVRDAVALAVGDPAALAAHAAELERQMGEAADDDALTALLDAHALVLERIERNEANDGAARGEAGEALLGGVGLAREQWDRPVGTLSGGEKRLVALARELAGEPDVLLLDEPDNHLDFAGKRWLEGFVRDYPGAVAVISHDRWFIDAIANRIFELEAGKIEAYPGNYAAFLQQKRDRLERAAQLRELEEREFKKLKASAEQLTQWARQNPKFAPRAENMRRKLAEERERLAQTPAPILNRRQIDVAFAAERGSTLVLQAEALAKSFGDRVVFAPFDLTIRHGEAVGLVGANGAGKTTLFRLVMGDEEPTSGSLRLGPSVVVGYAAQEHETLDPAATALETIRKLQPMTEQAAIGFLNGLLFDRDDMLRPIGQLSGGERSRVQIACLIAQGANLLLLDEPTNNLDLASIERLEAALLAFVEAGRGTILAISHDRAFLDRVCRRIVELDTGVVRDYPGGFAYFDAHRGAGNELTIRPPTPAA
ncbi:MAG TPA: ABC-F family ATP-binding cassette domain-containing protein, partial [Thermomicrobiales bacterium]|nr:ABC-F family ATP-binding cassette domain-containing protein [Thermomicrobiales bacterium]